MRSPQFTSSIEPTDTKALKPTFSRRLQSKIAVQRATLADESDTARPRHACREGRIQACMRPHHAQAVRPDNLMPAQRANLMFQLRPAAPHSLKPAEMITAPQTPAATHSAIIPGTIAAGVAMTARSTASGTALMFDEAFRRARRPASGLPGKGVDRANRRAGFRRWCAPRCWAPGTDNRDDFGASIVSARRRRVKIMDPFGSWMFPFTMRRGSVCAWLCALVPRWHRRASPSGRHFSKPTISDAASDGEHTQPSGRVGGAEETLRS